MNRIILLLCLRMASAQAMEISFESDNKEAEVKLTAWQVSSYDKNKIQVAIEVEIVDQGRDTLGLSYEARQRYLEKYKRKEEAFRRGARALLVASGFGKKK